MSDSATDPNKQELPEIQSVQAPRQANPVMGGGAVDALFDIQVNLSIVVGQKKMKLKDIMKLAKDNVIELDKLAGDPLDIMVNDSLIAHGEIVVTNEKYGIRITDLANKSPITGEM